DVVLGDGGAAFLLRQALGPGRGGEENPIPQHDGAGPTGAGEVRVVLGAAVQRRFPDDVVPLLAVPGERQIFLLAGPQAGGSAPAGPIGGRGLPAAQERQRDQCQRPTDSWSVHRAPLVGTFDGNAYRLSVRLICRRGRRPRWPAWFGRRPG